MPKNKLVAKTDMNRDPSKVHHFFVSSAAAWRVGYDIAELLAAFKRESYPFTVWMVPGPSSRDYEIAYYAPQVEGAVPVVHYGYPE